MVGWALRLMAVSCVAALGCASVIDGGGWLASRLAANQAIGTQPVRADAPAAPPNTLVYAADARGHVLLDAAVNGVPVRFLVDTGDSYVTLTPADARAAGLSPRQLDFNERVSTANGEVRIATVTLRDIRLGQFSVENVPAAVLKNLDVSLLGMSFLKRLRSYEMRDGKLTIDW
jgi:aspartyl protease family protein